MMLCISLVSIVSESYGERPITQFVWYVMFIGFLCIPVQLHYMVLHVNILCFCILDLVEQSCVYYMER